MNTNHRNPGPTGTAGTSSRAAFLTIASAGPLLVLFAFTIPLTTLSSTAASLGVGPGGQAWILSAMSVGAAAGLLSSGAVGDDYGRRLVFVLGSVVLAAASLLGALAPSGLVLIIARILQGLGGAAVVACSLGLIGHAFPSVEARSRATAVWAAALGAGVAIGPVLSAWLDKVAGWRWAYALAAVAAVALAAAAWTLPESKAARPSRIDVAGTLLLGLGLACLLAGLVEGRAGWETPLVLALLGGGVLLLAAFIAVERRAGAMLDLALFRRPDFVGATVAAFAAGAGVLSLVSLVPTLLERVLGVSTLVSSAVILAWSATSAVTAYGVRWLPASLSPRARLVLSLIGVAVGQIALLGLDADSSVIRFVPGLLLAGIANGILNAALGYQSVASVPADRAAMGSGANNTARYLGSSIGLALVTVLLTHAGASSGTRGLLAGWNTAVVVTTVFSLVGAAVVFLARERVVRPALQ